MSDIVIKKPELNPGQVEKSLAAIDTWIHDTADKLNFFFSRMEGQTGTESASSANEKSDARLRSYVQQALQNKPDAIEREQVVAQYTGALSAGQVKLLSASEPMKEGKNYFVRWNQIVYACARKELEGETYHTPYLGNAALIPGGEHEDTKEPFVLFVEEGQEVWSLCGQGAYEALAVIVYRKVYELSEDLMVETIEGYLKGTAAEAECLKTGRLLDGIPFNGSENVKHYVQCTTAADAQVKEVWLDGFQKTTGSLLLVRFAYGNTVASPKLRINGGTQDAVYDGETLLTANAIETKKAYFFVWTGSLWELVG